MEEDEAVLEALGTSGSPVIPDVLDDEEQLVLDWAVEATRDPEAAAGETTIEQLRGAGFDERAILDAILTIGYFNFVNRLVLLTGATLEPAFEQTCGSELAG